MSEQDIHTLVDAANAVGGNYTYSQGDALFATITDEDLLALLHLAAARQRQAG